MQVEIVTNQNEREAFLSSIKETRYAGIDAVRSTYRTLSLNAHRQEFISNKRGHRDGHRAALFMEVTKLKNAEAAVLSFFISLSMQGFKGAVCPEDVIAAQVVESTGAKCAPRTFRRALAALCRAGWLVKKSMATGSKIPTHKGWTTLQVNKITVPHCTRLLGSRKSPVKAVVVPRPNGPAIGESKQVTPLSKGGLPCLSLSNSKLNSKERNEEIQLATAQQATPKPLPKSPSLKHQAVESEGRHAAPKTESQQKKVTHPFGRKSRSKIANTWHNCRLSFLHDLQAAGCSDFELRTAEMQTDLRYPPMLPVALDWNRVLPKWLEMDWKARRRAITRDILPDLAAWCNPLVPPDMNLLYPSVPRHIREKAESQMAQFQRVSKLVKSLPEMLITPDTPDFVREIVADKAWTLSQVPALLAMGRISLDEITQDEYADFQKIAELVNMAD